MLFMLFMACSILWLTCAVIVRLIGETDPWALALAPLYLVWISWDDYIKPLLVVLLVPALVLVSCTSQAQTASEPAYANMQRAVGGILQSVAASRGVSATDPRTYATLYGMGRAAVGATTAGAVGTGLLVAAGTLTAPSWGTVLATAAISGAVVYALEIGWDMFKRWAFSSAGVKDASMFSTTFTCSSGSGQNGADCACAAPKTGTVTLLDPAIYGANQYQVKCSCVIDSNGACVGSGVPPSSVPVITMAAAANALTTAQKAQPVSPKAMAMVVNETWKNAAAQPGYAGLPYSASQPVTTSEVQTWAAANPAAYPTVGALVAPVTSPDTGFAPSATTSPTSSVQPATTPTNPYASPATGTAPAPTGTASSPTVVDFGPNPNIGFNEPTAPTAQSIFQPFLDIVEPFIRFEVNAPAGECPKPVFNVFGEQIEMIQHCDILEALRSTIINVMSAVFAVAAFIIIFTA